MSEFIAWFTENVIAVREHFGFRIEFRLVDHDKSEFTWCISLPGNEEEFTAVQDRYSASSERAKAFESYPGCIDQMHLGFVEVSDLSE